MFNLNEDVDNEVTNNSSTDHNSQIGSRKSNLLPIQSLMQTNSTSLNNDINVECFKIMKIPVIVVN